MTNEKIYVTEEGLKDLQEQYNNLVHVVREEITEELKAARLKETYRKTQIMTLLEIVKLKTKLKLEN